MALIKTSRRSHGPTIYTLELTEAEARAVLEESHPDSGVHDALSRVLPPVDLREALRASVESAVAPDPGAPDYGPDADGTEPSKALPGDDA